MPTTGTAASLHALLQRSIDYAGLFPPAGLAMAKAVSNYAAYQESEYAWMLGRFVLPAARLAEFASAAEEVPSEHTRWPLSVLLGDAPETAMEAAVAFERAGHAGVALEAMEFVAASPSELERLGRLLPGDRPAYAEVPLDSDPQPFAEAAAAAGLGLKARTGGVTADAFPDAVALARFIETAVRRAVRFKFTAGLHHPVRGDYRLTYESDAVHGSMFGFLNALLAAALAAEGGSRAELAELLLETDLVRIGFDDLGAWWRDHRIDQAKIERTRELVSGFGSCSFTEPVEELVEAGLLR